MANTLTQHHRAAAPNSETPATPKPAARMALAVADAGWFNTENQFREIPESRAETLLLHCADYRNAWRDGERPWSWNKPAYRMSPGVWKKRMVLPTGWMKKYPKVGMKPIAREIRRWKAENAADLPLTLVMSYPYYLYLRDELRVDRLVYYNFDDYSQYWPKVASEVAEMERRAAREADITICVSRLRAELLREAVPEAADRIKHLPHGATRAWIPEEPLLVPAEPPADIAHIPSPRIGYVGTMEDRVDWTMLAKAAQENPQANFVLLGRIDPDNGAAWQAERRRCLAMPNIHAIGWRNQSLINSYIRSFDLGMIPYQVEHPFNIACCPTKIMDYIAAGRPFVATDVPECRLHRERFDVVTRETFSSTISERLAGGCDDGKVALRHQWALSHTCRDEMLKLLDWLA
ncbi:glycosyltransferase [Tundrisphaera sp. TA3]|uniref:glycosyltransferase n=1 Tax=Tundrisphaera sp. TA3 TaxID=3435775 RepID=UPI003EBD37CC